MNFVDRPADDGVCEKAPHGAVLNILSPGRRYIRGRPSESGIAAESCVLSRRPGAPRGNPPARRVNHFR